MILPGLIQFRKCDLTDKQLAEAVANALSNMYKEPIAVPSRHIPARPNEDFDLLVGEIIYRFNFRTANSYLLKFDRYRLSEICVRSTMYDDNDIPSKWAIMDGEKFAMSKKDGKFYLEPVPSERDDDWFSEFRFDSFEEAERIYSSFHCR